MVLHSQNNGYGPLAKKQQRWSNTWPALSPGRSAAETCQKKNEVRVTHARLYDNRRRYVQFVYNVRLVRRRSMYSYCRFGPRGFGGRAVAVSEKIMEVTFSCIQCASCSPSPISWRTWPCATVFKIVRIRYRELNSYECNSRLESNSCFVKQRPIHTSLCTSTHFR